MFDPNFWLGKSNFVVGDFINFIKELGISIEASNSKTAGTLISLIILSLIFFREILGIDNGEKSYFLHLNKLIADKNIKKSIDDLSYASLKSDNTIRSVKKIVKLIIVSLDEVTHSYMAGTLTKDIFPSGMVKKAMNKIRRNKELNNEYSQLLSLNDNNDFLGSIFDKFMDTKSEDTSINILGLKYMFINSPINGGKVDINDLIDLQNISFVDNISSYEIIYVTNDRRWKNFIDEYVGSNGKLQCCLIFDSP